jgi:hypothetical protein
VYAYTDGNPLGSDLLGREIILSGGRFRVDPRRDAGCIFNVRVVYSDGSHEERLRQNLCNLNEIVFSGVTERQSAASVGERPPRPRQEAAAPISSTTSSTSTNADFRLVNQSSQTITELFVSPVKSRAWGRDRLPGTVRPGASFEVRLPPDDECQYDIKVVYQDRTISERRGQNLCRLNELVFK